MFPSPLGVSYFQILLICIAIFCCHSFRPLSGYLISKYCPPEPAILLAFLTLLRGKSFSCIFFLYLTYTIASKCSIYAVRGKIIFFSNKLLHTPILTHISHVCIKIWYFQSSQSVNPPFSHLLLTDCSFSPDNCFLHHLQLQFTLPHHILFPIQLCTLQHMGWHTKAYILVVLMLPRHIGLSEDILCYPDSLFLLEKIIDNRLWDKSTAAAKKYCCIWDWCHTLIRKMLLKSFLISLIKDFNSLH